MLEPTEKNAAIAVYDSHSDAEEVIRELERRGFDMKKLSIVGKDYHTEEYAVGFYNMGDRVKAWGKKRCTQVEKKPPRRKRQGSIDVFQQTPSSGLKA